MASFGLAHGAWVAVFLVAACGSDSSGADGAQDASSSDAAGGSSGSASNDSGAPDSGGGAGSGGTGGSGRDAATGPNVDLTNPQLHELELDPKELDPSTTDSLETQYAQLDTRTTPIGKLVIFLSGATNTPSDWRDHGRKLAELGFHVLIPHYNNRWSNEGVCDGMGGSCSVDTRWEALVGEDTSSAIEISRADSAEGRVVTMLKHLVTAHVGGDWGYYLDGDVPRYDRTVIAGISHGAASTGLYAARRAFTRAVMHSGGPAGSSSATKLTPVSEWYAFAHTGDPAYDAIIGGWENFGLVGEPTSIDGSSAPYGGSHRLISSETTTYPHCSVVVHSSSPTDNAGNFVFEPAWRHLYGVSP